MANTTDPQIVTPEKAWLLLADPDQPQIIHDLAHTVFAQADLVLQTERKRLREPRAAVVSALRNLPDHLKPNMSLVAQIDARADAIENGADW